MKQIRLVSTNPHQNHLLELGYYMYIHITKKKVADKELAIMDGAKIFSSTEMVLPISQS